MNKEVNIPLPGLFQLFRSSFKATSEVEGLRGLLWNIVRRMMFSVSIIFAAIGLPLYFYYVNPAIQNFMDKSSSAPVLAVGSLFALLGLVFLILVMFALVAYLSVLISYALVGFWMEIAVSKVLSHFNHHPKTNESQLKYILRSVPQILVQVILILAAIICSYVWPVGGAIMALVLLAHQSGFDIANSYHTILTQRVNHKNKYAWRIRVGIIPAVLVLVPFVGWLLLPIYLFYASIGYAWWHECGGRITPKTA